MPFPSTTSSSVLHASLQPGHATPPLSLPNDDNIQILAMQDATNPNVEANPQPPALGGLREFSKLDPGRENLQRYGEVISRISNLLLENLLRWDTGRYPHHPFVIRPAMLGRSEADARLWIVVCCEERLKRRAKRFFNKQQMRELCEPPERPEVAIRVYIIAKPAIPLARVVAQLPARVIRGFAHNNELCGAPLWIFNPETSAARQVTLSDPWPYEPLVHHYDEPKEYAAEWRTGSESIAACSMKQDIPEHIQLLIEYLGHDNHDASQRIKETQQEGDVHVRYSVGIAEAGHHHHLRRSLPLAAATHGLSRRPHGGEWPNVLSRGPFVALPCRYDVQVGFLNVGEWNMEYDGHSLGEVVSGYRVAPFVGLRERLWRVLEPASWQVYDDDEDSSKSTEGEAVGPSQSSEPSSFSVTDSIANGRSYWDVVREVQPWQFKGLSADYPQVEIDSVVMIDHQQALNGAATRRGPTPDERYKVPVQGLRLLTWKHAPMNELVMDEPQKRLISRLVEARHSGLLLHLYGGPGLGKTFTAVSRCHTECIAAHRKRPLMTLSSSDVIDHFPAQHKVEMMKVIRAANKWQTIVHFVDADKLLAGRPSSGDGGSSMEESFRGVVEGAVALAAKGNEDSGETHVAREELEAMVQLSRNGRRPSTDTDDYRPLGLATSIVVAVAVATAVVGLLILYLTTIWGFSLQDLQSSYLSTIRDTE
ncbi:P-loop containing nucleoside triphosphate hydrolase protein [Apiospora phragmitis]|uniref:P-loop containing nucleoside triphosphate hydrolase protein n=1 Tax=Apiospora phragmitis TaxID=2905665 RepID=A0ABR1VST3_9PEZI